MNTAYATPWKITDTGSAFKVVSAEGRALAYVYYRTDGRMADEFLSRDEAREMAQAIARLSKT